MGLTNNTDREDAMSTETSKPGTQFALMEGYNDLKINQATIVAALQLWANSVFVHPPKITSVNKDPDAKPGTIGYVVRIDSSAESAQ